jgi:hypothetical protein
MAADPKAEREQGERDTEERPVLTDKDEKERKDEDAREKPVDPE